MANLRDVRLRMRAIKQTLQVTKAMNLISTSKLRRGRRILVDTKTFFTRIQKSMFDIISGAESVDSDFFRKPESSKSENLHTAVIVITSDKGLAGGYNVNVIKKAKELCNNVKNPVLILIGLIGRRYFYNSPYPVIENFSFHSQLPTVENAEEVADYLISQFLWGMLNEIHIVYTHMYSAIKLKPTVRQILPLYADKIQKELTSMGNEERVDLKFEYLPDEKSVFDALVPMYIKGIIYESLMESHASEQSARMTAMDESTKNAQEMLNDLKIKYNRARQAGISNEIIEIVSGSAAI